MAKAPDPSLEAKKLIDDLCDRFEAALQDGSASLLEHYLAEAPSEVHPHLFRDLLQVELDHRQKQGRPMTPEEAREQFWGLGSWVPDILAEAGLEPALTLEVVGGSRIGQTFRLIGHCTFLVGRGPGVNLALVGDRHLSKIHFCVEYNPPHARVTDWGSKNGTFHNGKRMESRQSEDLNDGDEIRAGETVVLGVRWPSSAHTWTAVPEPVAQPTSSDHPPVRVHPGLSALGMAAVPSIPGYALECELGRGGMGVVYKARRLSDNETVAIKTILPVLAPNPETAARFQREVSILQRLTHPHIVCFHESGVLGGLLYFVMEYVEGISAANLVKQQGPQEPGRVVELGCQLLEALAHAHAQGLVHRDVKPGNVLLSRCQDGSDFLTLADFGLARAYQASALSGLTMSNQPGGTPAFMPPEQVRDFRSAKPPADQYAAAATLYYLLTGQHVYERVNSMLEFLNCILYEEPVPLRTPAIHPPLPGRLGPILRRALARDPGHRYPDVLALRDELRRAL
jgi:serine/threonine-protein kinase